MKGKIFLVILLACNIGTHTLFAQETTMQASAKAAILAAETAFCKMAKEQGIEAGYLSYAADDAVLCRTTKVYKGKEAIKKYFDKQDRGDQLTWKADFVSVSDAGDMGYTYGQYDFSGTRAGMPATDHGIFRTVWKKQRDGSWKFVMA